MNKPEQIQPSNHPVSRTSGPVQNHLITRIRFQLGGGLLVAVLLPAIIRYQSLFSQIHADNAVRTMIGTALAVSIGYFISRRLAKFPGDTAPPYILLVYSVVFGIVISVFFLLRLEYNRYLFISGFVVCLVWFVAVHFSVRQIVKTRLAIIPGGNAEELLKIGHVQWTLLKSTKMYDPKDGAIVADLRSEFSPGWERFIAKSALQGIPVFHSKQVQERLTGKVAIEHLSENTFGSLLPEMDYLRFKQLIDLVATIVFFPLILIILAVVSVTILVTSGGPVFFKQERVGYRGLLFTAYKFRTMVADNEGDQHAAGRTTKKARNHAMTGKDDKRITRFGAFLRKYRIDELPQALNILKGEMSWIGPRPEAHSLSLWYQKELPFYSYRHVVRPGITGWAQVNQGHVTQTDQVLEKLQYDFFFYIKNLSAWLDLLVMMRTIRVVFLGIGAR